LSTGIWWIRRDLRVHDNPALLAAAEHDCAIPVFVLDPSILDSPYVGCRRTAFLLDGLRSLDRQLHDRGGRLVVRRGDPVQVIPSLVAEVGAARVYATADYSPYSRRRDEAVARCAPVQFLGGPTVRHPDEVTKADGGPYSIFGPYNRKWRSLLVHAHTPVPAPERLGTPETVASLPIPPVSETSYSQAFPPGELAARSRLNNFVDGGDAPIARYAEFRDCLDGSATACLSPYLRFGMLSAEDAVDAAAKFRSRGQTQADRSGADAWLDELVWREFFVSCLYHYPETVERSFRPSTRSVTWRNYSDDYEAWCAGSTGYPVVDAAMRQLAAQGWLHNRARMIAASFLVKDLLVDWRWGERFFRRYLLDGDPAANVGNWQWVAGTGADAAPYFRIFNPVTQGKRHDPEGVWVRHWVPELRRVPASFVHEPWLMDQDVQVTLGCVLGRDYPHPIVKHACARERALAAYREARDSAES
jgi:deoxyribodipyrimidine photo-lyase